MNKKLKVSECGHFLEYEDGRPFFYLADTAWEMFHRLDRSQAKQYLQDRADKDFTVIQAVALAELGGLDVPNPYGNLPLHNLDPARPNELYFNHIDFIVDQAEGMGLFMGILPTWGRYWSGSSFAIADQHKQTIFTKENAFKYGQFLGRRYKDKPVIWILGGDRNVKTAEEKVIISEMAKGLKEGDAGNHLITYHPMGPGRSSELWNKAEWLDFHMSQSSHGARDHDNGIYAWEDYQLEPAKPTIDGEPRYETIPVGFYYKDARRLVRFDDFDSRQAAYWSVLAGACGHTYGNNNIWQMWTPGREPAIKADTPWDEALNHAGAWHMKYLRRLFESRPYNRLIPDNGQLIVDGPRSGGAKIRAGTASDGSFAIIYSPYGESFTVDRQQLKADRIKEIWYDPRYGRAYHEHTGECRAMQTYSPPTSGRGQDWILIIEDESAGFTLPGE